MSRAPKAVCARAGAVGCKGKATSNCDVCVPCCVGRTSASCHSQYHRKLRRDARASAGISAPVTVPGSLPAGIIPAVSDSVFAVPGPASGSVPDVPSLVNTMSAVSTALTFHDPAAVASHVHDPTNTFDFDHPSNVNVNTPASSSSSLSSSTALVSAPPPTSSRTSASSSFANPLSSMWSQNQSLGAYLQRCKDDVLRDEESVKCLDVLRVSECMKKTVQFRVWIKSGECPTVLRIYLPAHPHYVLSELPALVTTLPSDTTHCDVFSPMSSGWITLDLESAYSVDSGASEVCLRISGLSDQDCPTFPALGVTLPASSSKHPRSSSPGPGSPQHPSKCTKLDVVKTTAPITGPSTYVPSTPSTHSPKFPSGYSFSAVWNFVEATDTLRRDSRVDVVVALGNNLHRVTCHCVKRKNRNLWRRSICDVKQISQNVAHVDSL
ncbi:hypothetical protein C2E23DRAFT_847850 [Lenzites betulinus]|nr:hypothetical protein C2E23DRAFT_847850 [Lenzites betulinus]